MKININMNKGLTVLVAFLIIFSIAGCTKGPIKLTDNYEEGLFSPEKEIETQKFSSVQALKDFLKDKESSNYYGGLRAESLMMSLSGTDTDSSSNQKVAYDSAVPESGSSSREFSETNIQVKGVDEADIIKTDGEYIYTVTGKTLFLIKAYPGEEAEVISKIVLENNPQGLFIMGDKIAVFGNYHNLDFFKKIDFTPRTGMNYFNIYNISDKENPELLKEYKFEGRYFQARLIDEHVYFVVTSNPDYRNPIPILIDGLVKREMPISSIRYFNIPYNNPSYATIYSINLKTDKQVDSKTVVIEGYPNMYMSQNNIYITYTENINEWELEREITIDLMIPKLNQEDKDLITRIKQTPNDILSKYEKESKIYNIIESYAMMMSEQEQDELQTEIETALKEQLKKYDYFEYTIINKVKVDKGLIEVVANGKAPGHVINQFSMDEYESVLRIGTTINGRWSRFDKKRTESTNNVLTLDENLEILAHLKDLAEGESIYSTRFIGDKLYMVTFRQIDPFFVIDLSNPYEIKSLGELKIPGFSRYLHPYDENTIIGIGRETTESGRMQGLKISLFDVSEVENPKEIAKFVTEENYAQSTAEYEHKAFLFNKDKELLVIPAYNYAAYRDETDSYNGAMIFRITKDEIELRGLIDHSEANSDYRYQTAVERSLYIEDLLYTKSPTLLRINNLEDLKSVKNVELKQEYSGDIPIY